MAVARIIGELLFFLCLVLASEVVRHGARRRCTDDPIVGGLLVCSLVLCWYSTSVTLVLFNKWVLSNWLGTGLKFPIFYTMTHMFFKGVFSLAYLTCVQCKSLPQKSWRVVKQASFIGIFVGLDVAASNLSFQYISVTFYVMVKASGLIWILVFGAAAGMEQCSAHIVGICVVIASGMFLSMYGEADFNLTGFWLVTASEICSATRWVGTQSIMREGEVDSVTAVLYMSPGSTLSLLPLVLARERGELRMLLVDDELSSTRPGEYIMLVLVPSFLAFLLLIIEVRLVKETSSLTLSVFGNLKSMVTILFAIVVFQENASPLQWCGLVIGMFGIMGYSYVKNVHQVSAKYEVIEVLPPADTKEVLHPHHPHAVHPGDVEVVPYMCHGQAIKVKGDGDCLGHDLQGRA